MPSKYGNVRVEDDGIRFDSQAEANRYGELRLLERISDLTVHPRYELQPASGDIRSIVYEGDFAFQEAGNEICEEIKGYETEVWKIKRKMMMYHWPDVELRVIKAGRRRGR